MTTCKAKEWCGQRYWSNEKVPAKGHYPDMVFDSERTGEDLETMHAFCSASCRDAAARPTMPALGDVEWGAYLSPGPVARANVSSLSVGQIALSTYDKWSWVWRVTSHMVAGKYRAVILAASKGTFSYAGQATHFDLAQHGCVTTVLFHPDGTPADSPSVPGGAGQGPTSASLNPSDAPSCRDCARTGADSCERCSAPATKPPTSTCRRCSTSIPTTMAVCVPCEKEIIVRGKSTVTDHQEDVFYKGKAFRESLSRPLSHDERIGLAICGGWRRSWGAGR